MNDSSHSLSDACILYLCTTAMLAALLVALLFFISLLPHATTWGLLFTLVAPIVIVVLLPWFGLTYIFASKRFPVQWHWLISAIAALAATQGLRLLPSTLRPNLTRQIQSVCDTQSGEMVELPKFLHCAGTAWSALVQGAIIDAALAGTVLIAAAWALSHYKRRQA